LYLTLRRPPPSRDWTTAKLAKNAKTGFSRRDLQTANWTPDTPRPGKVSVPLERKRFPDFSQRTKQVVMRWFHRGLSGHLLWLIGDRMLDPMFPGAQTEVHHEDKSPKVQRENRHGRQGRFP
jgi:hypothetical protein